jgi:dTDP-4-dehydrorhamnose 3,5-epimerase
MIRRMSNSSMLACTDTQLPGVRVLVPRAFEDGRGVFMESYNRRSYEAVGICHTFVQDNFSRSCQYVIRGLHYQVHHQQAKLVLVTRGEIFDVAVDIRRGSPTFGRWVGEVLSAENHRIMFIPEGFAHGFCVCSPEAEVLYKCSDYYTPDAERGIAWNDPQLGIVWLLPAGTAPMLSDRDRRFAGLADRPVADLPVFRKEGSGFGGQD